MKTMSGKNRSVHSEQKSLKNEQRKRVFEKIRQTNVSKEKFNCTEQNKNIGHTGNNNGRALNEYVVGVMLQAPPLKLTDEKTQTTQLAFVLESVQVNPLQN